MEDYTNLKTITSAPTPDLIQIGPEVWVREFALLFEDTNQIHRFLENSSLFITAYVIRLLKSGFSHRYQWISTITSADFSIFLYQLQPNNLTVRIQTGKYTLSDPFFIFALMLTIRVLEWKIGSVVGFRFNGVEYLEWDIWRNRKMYLGILVDDGVLETELNAQPSHARGLPQRG